MIIDLLFFSAQIFPIKSIPITRSREIATQFNRLHEHNSQFNQQSIRQMINRQSNEQQSVISTRNSDGEEKNGKIDAFSHKFNSHHHNFFYGIPFISITFAALSVTSESGYAGKDNSHGHDGAQ
jgi:hypothetical protein